MADKAGKNPAGGGPRRAGSPEDGGRARQSAGETRNAGGGAELAERAEEAARSDHAGEALAADDRGSGAVVGAEGDAARGRVARAAAFLPFAFALGLLTAFAVRAVLFALAAAGRLLWGLAPVGGFDWAPLLLCPLGGLAIGLWTRRFGGAPESLDAVIGSIRETGSYRSKSIPASFVGFALPLLFGGAIGPEAGLAGLIASLCSWACARLERAGRRVQAVADVTVSAAFAAVFGAPLAGIVEGDEASAHERGEVSFRRGAKIAAYTVSAAGAFAGLWLFGLVAGASEGLPRLDAMDLAPSDLPWALVCLAAAWALALVYAGAETGFARLSERVGAHPVAKPLACGIALGAVGAVLPLSLFSGEEQLAELAASWQAVPALVLLASALAKALLTPLCLTFGWRGGHFFPCIFMGAALGYGIAAASGADPVFCAAVACGAFLACSTRRPLLSAALLLLCFPVSGMPWVVLAAVIGGRLPLPRVLRG